MDTLVGSNISLTLLLHVRFLFILWDVLIFFLHIATFSDIVHFAISCIFCELFQIRNTRLLLISHVSNASYLSSISPHSIYPFAWTSFLLGWDIFYYWIFLCRT